MIKHYFIALPDTTNLESGWFYTWNGETINGKLKLHQETTFGHSNVSYANTNEVAGISKEEYYAKLDDIENNDALGVKDITNSVLERLGYQPVQD